MNKLQIMNNDLWHEHTIKDIGQVVSGFGFPIIYQGNKNGKYPFAKVGDISQAVQRGELILKGANNYIDDDILQKLRVKSFPEGTTVFAKIGEALKLNRRIMLGQDTVVDNNVMGIIPNTKLIEPEYLYYFLRTIDLTELSHSTTVPSLKKSDVENIQILLPDRPIQVEIVNKLNIVLRNVCLAREQIMSANKKIDILSQSILVKAFKGELVS